MAVLNRIRTEWTGFPGGPGVTTFYSTNAVEGRVLVSDLLGGFLDHIPNSVTLTVPNTGDIIDSLSGALTGTWSSGTPISVGGGYNGTYAAPVGAQIRWQTGTIIDGHKLVGKTFLVPLGSSAFQSDGTLDDVFRTASQVTIDAIIARSVGNLVVFHRPRAATPSWTDVHGKLHPAKPARAGGFSSFQSGSMADKAVVLRSRRD